VTEDTYSELIELIRAKKSRNVAVFQRARTDSTHLQSDANEGNKDKIDKNDKNEKYEKKTNFSFLDISMIDKENLGDLKFNQDAVKDVTEQFKKQILPVGT